MSGSSGSGSGIGGSRSGWRAWGGWTSWGSGSAEGSPQMQMQTQTQTQSHEQQTQTPQARVQLPVRAQGQGQIQGQGQVQMQMQAQVHHQAQADEQLQATPQSQPSFQSLFSYRGAFSTVSKYFTGTKSSDAVNTHNDVAQTPNSSIPLMAATTATTAAILPEISTISGNPHIDQSLTSSDDSTSDRSKPVKRVTSTPTGNTYSFFAYSVFASLAFTVLSVGMYYGTRRGYKMGEDEDLDIGFQNPSKQPDFTLRQKASTTTKTDRRYHQVKRSYTNAFRNSYTAKIDATLKELARKKATKALIVGTTASCAAAFFASWAFMIKYNIRQTTDIPAAIEKMVAWHMDHTLVPVRKFFPWLNERMTNWFRFNVYEFPKHAKARSDSRFYKTFHALNEQPDASWKEIAEILENPDDFLETKQVPGEEETAH